MRILEIDEPLVPALEAALSPTTFTTSLLYSDDLLPSVLSHLDSRSTIRAAQTCKHLHGGRAVAARLRSWWVPTEVCSVPKASGRGNQLISFVAVLPEGDLLASDTHGHSVCRLRVQDDGTCMVLGRWDGRDMGRPGSRPSGLAVRAGDAGDSSGSSSSSSFYSVWTGADDENAPVLELVGRVYEVALGGGERRPPSQLLPTESCLDFPLGCAFSPATGLVYVVDSDSPRVVALDPRTRAVRFSFGGRKSRSEGLQDPYDVAVRGGKVYVSDSGHGVIAVFDERDARHRFLDWLRLPTGGRLQLDDPSGLAFAADGRLLVANTSGWLSIHPLEPSGLALRASPIGRQQLLLAGENSLGGVAVDEASPRPRVIVADSTDNVLRVLEPATLASLRALHGFGGSKKRHLVEPGCALCDDDCALNDILCSLSQR